MSRALLASSLMAGITCLASLNGCAAEPEREKDVSSQEAELRLAAPMYLGDIASGQTRSAYYKSSPRYRAFGFTAKGGDAVTIDIRSGLGDAVGWLTNETYDVLAFNDDASPSTWNSHIKYEVPAGTPAQAYRIVFRDYDLFSATFHVSLSVVSAPEPVTCNVNGTVYGEGASFPSADGCNTCTCASAGVACTKKACVCNPEAEPWRRYLGTPTTCMTIRYTCFTNERSFQNECGCGCEQSIH